MPSLAFSGPQTVAFCLDERVTTPPFALAAKLSEFPPTVGRK